MGNIEPLWKVLPHPDHQTSEVITRKMTTEERQKYGVKLQEDIKMNKQTTKITTEEMLEYAKKNGMAKLHEYLIHEKGMSSKTASNEIYRKKIREKLKELEAQASKVEINKSGITVSNDQRITTITTSKQGLVTATKHKSPKPKVLLSQEIPGVEYCLFEECLQINTDKGNRLEIAWEDLENFLSDISIVKSIE